MWVGYTYGYVECKQNPGGWWTYDNFMYFFLSFLLAHFLYILLFMCEWFPVVFVQHPYRTFFLYIKY